MAESFFSTLKTKLIGSTICANHAAGTRAIGNCIATVYRATSRRPVSYTHLTLPTSDLV